MAAKGPESRRRSDFLDIVNIGAQATVGVPGVEL